MENVAPFLWYRRGISDKSEIGFRVGLPIYGTGIDYSRVVFNKENKWDLVNLAWSLNPNYNIDATYYKFKTNKSDTGYLKSRWIGLRGMIIQKGITNNSSNRLGLLMGFQSNPRWGVEFGYFHDPSSLPINQLFNPTYDPKSPDNPPRFADKSMKDSTNVRASVVFETLVDDTFAGQEVSLKIWRNKEELIKKITLGKLEKRLDYNAR